MSEIQYHQNLRDGAAAAATVLAVPVTIAALALTINAVGLHDTTIEVETSGTLVGLFVERNVAEVSLGWPMWIALAVLVFVWRSGVVASLYNRLRREPSITPNQGPFDQFGPLDRLRLAMTVERVDTSLLFRVPNQRRKAIRQELEANLVESASIHGAPTALHQLGSVRSLIRNYLNAEQRRFDFVNGLMVALSTYVVTWIIALLAAVVFNEGWRAGGASVGATQRFGYFEVSAAESSFAVTFDMAFVLPIVIVAFIIGSRPWRLWTRPER